MIYSKVNGIWRYSWCYEENEGTEAFLKFCEDQKLPYGGCTCLMEQKGNRIASEYCIDEEEVNLPNGIFLFFVNEKRVE